jgi:uncharacterized protein YndB with AHSA1/START domain
MSHSVTVSKTIQVPPAVAFHAWTDAPTWSRWFSPNTRVDLRVGGSFANDDGDRGVYLEIEPERRLRFSWDGSFAGSRVELGFVPHEASACEVTLRHEGLAAAADAEKMQKCWTWTLATLATFLEASADAAAKA